MLANIRKDHSIPLIPRVREVCHALSSRSNACKWLTARGLPRVFRKGLGWSQSILVPRGRAPFGQHQESRPLAMSKTGSLRFTDFPSLYAYSEPNLPNLIGSGLNLLCLQSHSKPEYRWTRPEVAILGADQKERGLWGREWFQSAWKLCPIWAPACACTAPYLGCAKFVTP